MYVYSTLKTNQEEVYLTYMFGYIETCFTQIVISSVPLCSLYLASTYNKIWCQYNGIVRCSESSIFRQQSISVFDENQVSFDECSE